MVRRYHIIALALLLIVGSMGYGVVKAAEFGSAWTEQGTNALPVAISQHTTVAFDGQLWVIGGDTGGTASRKVYSSTDGITWAEVGTDALPAARRNHCSVVYDGQMWVVGGENSAGAAQDDIYHSSDGLTWSTEAAAIPENLTGPGCAVAQTSGLVSALIVAGGSSSSVYSTDIYAFISNDPFFSAPGSAAAQLPAAVGEGVMVSPNGISAFHIGGTNGTPQTAVYGIDLGKTSTVTSAIALPAERARGGAVLANGRFYHLGGIDATVPVTSAGQDDVLSSLPGGTWVNVGNGALPVDIYDFGFAMFQGKAWVTGGNVAGTQVRTVYATDDIAGLTPPGSGNETITDLSIDVAFTSQSADTANSALPLMDVVAAEQAETGWPLVNYTIFLGFLVIVVGIMFFLGRIAPDNLWLTAFAAIAVSAAAFVVGQGAIPWYIVLAITLFVTGVASFTGRVLSG